MVHLFRLSPASEIGEVSTFVHVVDNGLHEFNHATLDPKRKLFGIGESVMESRCRGTGKMWLLGPATRHGTVQIFLLRLFLFHVAFSPQYRTRALKKYLMNHGFECRTVQEGA